MIATITTAMAFSRLRSSPIISTLLVLTVLFLSNGTTDALKPDNTFLHVDGKLDTLPDTGEQWQSMPNGMEFQPAKNLSPLAEYHLRRLISAESDVDIGNHRDLKQRRKKKMDISHLETIYIDGGETYYDEYAQAWRVLGFYIDCDYCGEDHDHADCVFTNENNNKNNDNENDMDNWNEARGGCQRFLLWAAYIDEEYSGGGVGEYAYYNRKTLTYDDTACQITDNERCAKMDCHEPNTHFTLLGFFKEPNYSEWMEQLFKHLGDCVWSDREYQFMQQDRQEWPNGCIDTNFYVATSRKGDTNMTLYFDLKPEKYGEMGLGLYTDARCIRPYTGKDAPIDKVIRHMICANYNNNNDDNNNNNHNDENDWSSMCSSGGNYYKNNNNNNDDRNRNNKKGYNLENELERWNSAFDVYKQCQPCKAYDLTNYVTPKKQGYNHTGYRQQNNRDRDDNQDGSNNFVCHDDAGYDSVNQCMKFRTKTKMLTASWSDIELAGHQGTITDVPFPHMAYKRHGFSLKDKYEANRRSVRAWFYLFLAALFFAYSYHSYLETKHWARTFRLKRRLMRHSSENGVMA